MGCLLAFFVALVLGGGVAFLGTSGSSSLEQRLEAIGETSSPEAVASSSTAPSSALVDALAYVPDTAAARDSLISYVDQRAVERARAGAARPASFAELRTLMDADDPSGTLWVAAMQGVASGDSGLVRDLFGTGQDWPRVVGLDFFDIDRQVAFGAPPGDGVALMGRFDPVAIADAHEARGYSATQVGARTLLCGENGCDGGLRIDLAHRERADPFGGDLGRQEPLAVSATDVLASADLGTLQGMLDATSGATLALADDPAVRAVASAADPTASLLQATIVPTGAVGVRPDIYRLLTGSPEGATALLAELADVFEPIPAWDVAAILDGATADEQVVTVALAYADEADAAVAAEVLPRRLATLPSMVRDVPIADLLDGRGVTSVTGRVVPADEGREAAAVIQLRAPLAGAAPDPSTGRPRPSSLVYRLLIDMIATRDVIWLVPVLPLE